MDRLFVDTGAWMAYINKRDPSHKPVKQALDEFGGRLVTTNFIFDEAVTLCAFRGGHLLARRVGGHLLAPDVVDLVRVTVEDEAGAWKLFLAREDKEYSFTDCTSFVVMRRLGLTRAASVDDDFSREGFQTVPGL
ncbi:MAG: type II toxin-antitoxin system VapC family toxin [Myxococcales bacterium]|nr:type II toxin-antitoxin system VapC family toxin [Myxococcales bacterium]